MNVIFNGFEYQIGIQFKIAMCYVITHSHNIYPWNVRKVRCKEIRCYTINSINPFTNCSDKSAIRGKKLHPSRRRIIILRRVYSLIPFNQIFNCIGNGIQSQKDSFGIFFLRVLICHREIFDLRNLPKDENDV